MISAKDELAHLVANLSEEEAERVLDALNQHCPDLYRHPGEPPPRPEPGPGLVAEGLGCPECGERHADRLEVDEESSLVYCLTCDNAYDMPGTNRGPDGKEGAR